MTGVAWLYTRGSERQVTLKPNAALRRAGFKQTTLCDASALSSQSLSLSEAREEIERLKGLVAGTRECPQEPWQATPERITQKYLRRYPTSKMTRSWAGCMVHISTEHGVWRINGEGYTRAGNFDAWVLPFEEAQSHVAHCGPEKEAAFIKVVQPIGSGRSLADAHTNPPSSDLSSLRKGAEVPCPHAPTYDVGLCCGHPDDCTFVSPSSLSKEEEVAKARQAVERLANVQMNISLEEWGELSSAILSALVSGSREDGA